MGEQITLAGRQVEVKQLTMRQIKNVMAVVKKQDNEVHVIDAVYNDPVPAVALAEGTGLSLEELSGDFNQEEVNNLLSKFKSINPFFVGMTERLVLGTRSEPSSKGSAS